MNIQSGITYGDADITKSDDAIRKKDSYRYSKLFRSLLKSEDLEKYAPRPKCEFVLESGEVCRKTTSMRKPYCIEHVFAMPGVAAMLALLEAIVENG